MSRLISCCIAGVLLVGCSSTAKVRYEAIEPVAAQSGKTSGDFEGKIKFNLQSTLIKIYWAKCDKDEQCTWKVTALPIPTEASGKTYAIVPQDDLMLKTYLKVTYIDNTRIISSIGSELEDNRIKVIQAAGTGIVAGLAMLKEGSREESLDIKLPVVIDVDRYETDCRKNVTNLKKCGWNRLPLNQKACYKMEFDELPDDAIVTEAFFSSIADRYTKVMIYSACRDLTLYVSTNTDVCSGGTSNNIALNSAGDFVAKLRVADPSYLQTMKFPNKGKIDMHSSCGANVTGDKTDTGNALSVISEILRQAKSVKEAQDKSR